MIERWTCLRPSMMFSSKEGKEYEEGYYTLYSDTKILIDALVDFIEDTEAHEGSFARIRSYHKFDKLKQALQEIGYEPK